MLSHRPLLLGVAAAVSVAGAAPAAHAATAPSCKPGTVAVRLAAHRTGCRALPTVPVTTGGQALAKLAPTPAQLRHAAPRRLRKKLPLAKLARLDGAIAGRSTARAAAVRDFAARAAAGGGCADAAMQPVSVPPQVTGGVKVTSGGGTWVAGDGATQGIATTMTADLGGGNSKTQTSKHCVDWPVCPDADGTLHGTEVVSSSETSVVKGEDGVELRTTSSIELDAELTAHVGADARARSFDMRVAGTGLVRVQLRQDGKVLRYLPRASVRIAFAANGLDPHGHGAAPADPGLRAWSPDHGLLDGSADADVVLAATMIGLARNAMPDGARDGLLKAEQGFYDRAACVDLAFTPPSAQLTPGQSLPVALAATAKDGSEVTASYTVTPPRGGVDPASGTTPAGLTYTAPADFPAGTTDRFTVEAVSPRGRALGTWTATSVAKPAMWRITFEGAGEYHRTENRGAPPTTSSDMSFSFRTSFKPAKIPYADTHREIPTYLQPDAVTQAGDIVTTWKDGSRNDRCDVSVDAGQQIGIGRATWSPTPYATAGYDIAITPFQRVSGAFGACDGKTEGSLAIWSQGVGQAMGATVRITDAELKGDGPIVRTVDHYDANVPCMAPNVKSCTASVDWHGTIRLERADG